MVAVAGMLWYMGHGALQQWTEFFRNVLELANTDSIRTQRAAALLDQH